MKSVDRALSLLQYFTVARPELGLSELARLSGVEKATVHRMLTALTRNGLLEQTSESRKYRLGANVLRLALVREATVPMTTIIAPVIAQLCRETGETTHATLGAKDGMMTIGISEPTRAARVFVDPSAMLPFHATASGMVYSAFAAPDVLQEILSIGSYPGFTPATVTTEAGFVAGLESIRRIGYAVAHGTLELDTAGVASAFFDAGGRVCGTVAVAGMQSRMDARQVEAVGRMVIRAANEVTLRLGGNRRLP